MTQARDLADFGIVKVAEARFRNSRWAGFNRKENCGTR